MKADEWNVLLADLEAEVTVLEQVVRRLSAEQFELPTPAVPWRIRDQIAHLADTDEVCTDQIRGGPRNLQSERQSVPPGEWTSIGVRRGAALDLDELVAWWRQSARRCGQALREVGPSHRIEWGPTEMSGASMATARLMETWAHGVDISDALAQPVATSARLRHVARLAFSAIPYARRVAGLDAIGEAFRVELDGDAGLRVVLGPEDAPNRISGDLTEFCCRAIQRRRGDECPSLAAVGPHARETLATLRAFA